MILNTNLKHSYYKPRHFKLNHATDFSSYRGDGKTPAVFLSFSLLGYVSNKYMLFAGLGSVRIVKNCDRGLENAARGRNNFFFPAIN